MCRYGKSLRVILCSLDQFRYKLDRVIFLYLLHLFTLDQRKLTEFYIKCRDRKWATRMFILDRHDFHAYLYSSHKAESSSSN